MSPEAPSPAFTTFVVGPSLLAKRLLDRLQVDTILDQAFHRRFPNVPTTYGTLALAIILNRMTLAPQPLYQLADWAAQHGIDRLLGIRAEWLDDDRLGAMHGNIGDRRARRYRPFHQARNHSRKSTQARC